MQLTQRRANGNGDMRRARRRPPPPPHRPKRPALKRPTQHPLPCLPPRPPHTQQMANGNGDMRWALEACSKAVDRAAKEAMAAATEEVGGPAPAPPAVGMRQMAAAMAKLTGALQRREVCGYMHVCMYRCINVWMCGCM